MSDPTLSTTMPTRRGHVVHFRARFRSMPRREAWRTRDAAEEAARAYFGADRWALWKSLYLGILQTRAESRLGARLVQLVDRLGKLRIALDVIPNNVRALKLALEGVSRDLEEAGCARRLLPATDAIAADAARLRNGLERAVEALDPAFERVWDGLEATAVRKIGATGRAALLKHALDDRETCRTPRAWAFAGIALRIERPCLDSDQFRERVGAWRREIKRIERQLARADVHD